MMNVICLHSRDDIAAVLRRNTWLNLYAIGDLDDFFWSHTLWYGLRDGNDIREIVLLYTAFETPVLHAITVDPAAMGELLRGLMHLLPRRIYSHLSSGMVDHMQQDYTVQEHGLHYKMALTHPEIVEKVDTSGVIPLTAADTDDLKALYQVGNPIAWFDARMLETGCYFGVRLNGQLVSVAGVHVYSPTYGAAAVANVVTHPDFRGRGYAKAACAKVCQSMRGRIEHIGLNVLMENVPAIRAYEQIGFETVGTYGEYMLELKR
jgi:ribosomal protein S18 acetylase RimI-like enzyme